MSLAASSTSCTATAAGPRGADDGGTTAGTSRSGSSCPAGAGQGTLAAAASAWDTESSTRAVGAPSATASSDDSAEPRLRATCGAAAPLLGADGAEAAVPSNTAVRTQPRSRAGKAAPASGGGDGGSAALAAVEGALVAAAAAAAGAGGGKAEDGNAVDGSTGGKGRVTLLGEAGWKYGLALAGARHAGVGTGHSRGSCALAREARASSAVGAPFVTWP
mmetsp:Transcript_8198/g.23045  ORF Transcript_8198/g.23045 Transcript_8198/m.23045 type:complete len:219 (-) Transcript_8198:418-1074(-)